MSKRYMAAQNDVRTPGERPLDIAAQRSISALNLVKLAPLMALTSGRPEITIGLIDGPVAMDHPDLARHNIREIPGKVGGACVQAASMACSHGTLVAGILSAKRGSPAPAICPECTLVVRPIFTEDASGDMPSASPEELAAAILDCTDAGVRIINLSMALSQSQSKEFALKDALDYGAKRGIIVVAAAGNHGTVGSSVISAHPWVIPVVAYSLMGTPLSISNLGRSIGLRGLGAPGEGILSSAPGGGSSTIGGTSAASAFATGAVALLLSEFRSVSAAEIRLAITQSRALQGSIVPPLLDAWAAYRMLIPADAKRR